MTTRCSRFDLPKQQPHPESEEKRKANPRALLTGDPLARFMSLHPLIVGLMFLVLGWGSLLLIAWRLEVITSVFLRSPAFMVGDLVLLPLATALMASFYRSASIEIPRESGVGITIASALIAAISAGATAAFSIFLSETYHGIWSVPHTLFIGLFAYVFVSFLPRAFYEIAFGFKTRKTYLLVPVVLLPMAHIALKSYVGGSLP